MRDKRYINNNTYAKASPISAFKNHEFIIITTAILRASELILKYKFKSIERMFIITYPNINLPAKAILYRPKYELIVNNNYPKRVVDV